MTTTLPIHLQRKPALHQDQPIPLTPLFPDLVSGGNIFLNTKEDARRFTSTLQSLNGIQKAPAAIIIRWDLMHANNFKLLKLTCANLFLSNTAIIAHSSTPIPQALQQKAISYGLDDYYETGTDWDTIGDRIEFIRKYKSTLLAESLPSREAETVFKVPFAKRAFDILVSSFLLLALSPVLLCIALLIKLESKGPVFYLSKRVGMGCQVFDFIKFRSMSNDADKKVKDLKHLNQYGNDITFFKVNNDPRVTKIGRLLRKTSFDEFPQLINVLKGDMSLVGNRPLPLYEAEQLTRDQWAKRFLAPAGMTGLWQVTRRGKGDMSVEERIDLDVQYADKYSLWFDLKIMAKTIPAMIQEENV